MTVAALVVVVVLLLALNVLRALRDVQLTHRWVRETTAAKHAWEEARASWMRAQRNATVLHRALVEVRVHGRVGADTAREIDAICGEGKVVGWPTTGGSA